MKKLISAIIITLIVTFATTVSAETKKTIKINYIKTVRNYTHIGVTVSHKGRITCNSLRHGKIISTKQFYATSADNDFMMSKDRGTKYQCYYSN